MHESTRTMYAENHAHAVDDDVQWCDLVTNALLAKTDPARFTRWDEQLKIYEHWGYILRAARDGMRVALSTAHGVDHHTAATSHHRGIHSFRHSFRLEALQTLTYHHQVHQVTAVQVTPTQVTPTQVTPTQPAAKTLSPKTIAPIGGQTRFLGHHSPKPQSSSNHRHPFTRDRNCHPTIHIISRPTTPTHTACHPDTPEPQHHPAQAHQAKSGCDRI